jgi:hypothetical protein
MNGSKHNAAIEYLNPAYVSGGISRKPHLISMKDVDQRNVTNSAVIIVLK